jgi:hypothetical protein
VRGARFIAAPVLAAACLALAGCYKPGLEVAQTDNESLKVHHLFDVEGCAVLRFYDGGEYHYLTTCQGSVTSRISEGKTSRPEEIPTEVRP